ncbi:hypothetical protein AVEN_188171-1 [Araneus ventricosus]|uniref:Uncharacterized protein n=1 Tax=Araneus ventricosus TaxID=182803 RepID=A0A4Y2I9S0_ARAVE|nr:hypothetical protein AVEN_188171-1 [Araneus ventricosus]
MRTIFPNVAQVYDKTSVSDRSADILINAALKDMGMINKDDSSKVVDRSKIRRKRIKARIGSSKGKMRENTLYRSMTYSSLTAEKTRL